MNGDDKQFIEVQMAVLKTTVEEWRRGHDQAAKERQAVLCQKFDEFRDKLVKVFTWLENLPCGTTMEKIKNLDIGLKNLQTNDIKHLEDDFKEIKKSLDKLHRKILIALLGALLSIFVGVAIWLITSKPPIIAP